MSLASARQGGCSEVAAPPPSTPEISVSLVTRDRPLFLEHALELIAEQDYPPDRFEVVLVDSSSPSVEPLLRLWPVSAKLGARLRYFHLDTPQSIGEKRNFAVSQSRGSIVMQWDDDDYYGPNRMRLQAAPIREGRARCTALKFGLWYFLDQDEFWRGPPAESGHGLNGGHPGTFAFDRTIWSETDLRLQYPPTNFADPDDFQAAAAELLHARTEEIDEEVDFIYVRHRRAAASCEGELQLGIEECVLGIYFEVLGVRGFGFQVDRPSFLPKSTHELWTQIRSKERTPAVVPRTATRKDLAQRFDEQTADALELLYRHLGRYSQEEVRRWAVGEALTDGTRKRGEIRQVFLQEVLPALLTRVMCEPNRFRADTLAQGVLTCSRLDHNGAGFLQGLASALRPRLAELTKVEAASAACAIEALHGTSCCRSLLSQPSESKRSGLESGFAASDCVADGVEEKQEVWLAVD